MLLCNDQKANLNHHTKQIHIKRTYDRETLISLRYSGHGVPRCTEDLVRRMGIFALAKRETSCQYIAAREQQLNNHVQTIHKIIRPYNSERQTPKLNKDGNWYKFRADTLNILSAKDDIF